MRCREIRLKRLRELVSEYGSVAALARHADVSETNLRNILNRVLNQAGNPKWLGDELAETLEKRCGKDDGWMDHLDTQYNLSPEAIQIAKDWSSLPGDIRLHMSEWIRQQKGTKNVTQRIPALAHVETISAFELRNQALEWLDVGKKAITALEAYINVESDPSIGGEIGGAKETK